MFRVSCGSSGLLLTRITAPRITAPRSTISIFRMRRPPRSRCLAIGSYANPVPGNPLRKNERNAALCDSASVLLRSRLRAFNNLRAPRTSEASSERTAILPLYPNRTYPFSSDADMTGSDQSPQDENGIAPQLWSSSHRLFTKFDHGGQPLAEMACAGSLCPESRRRSEMGRVSFRHDSTIVVRRVLQFPPRRCLHP